MHAAAADGSSADGLRAHSFAVADALSRDTLRTTADLPNAEAVAKRVLMCRADALCRICAEPPRTPTAAFLATAYECRTLREFLLTPQGVQGGQRGNSTGQGAFGDAAWLASQLDARQSIAEHAMALDAVHALVEARLSGACVQLRDARLLSPRTANFQQRFEVGVNEALLGAFPCALQQPAGLRHGVLYVSSGHVCFETPLCAAANTKLPLSRVASLERCHDPFRRLPDAIKMHLDDGGLLHLAAFQHRDEVHALPTYSPA